MESFSFSLWTNARVGRKLGLISLGFIAIIAVIMTFTIVGISEQKSDALVIDLAGRQRMLAQKFVKEVLLAEGGLPTEHQRTLRIHDETLEALINGGPAIEDLASGRTVMLPPAPPGGAEASLMQQRALSARLEAEAAALLQLPPGDPARAEKAQALVRAQADLVASADALVKLFSRASEAKVQRMITTELAIAVLAALAAFVASWLVARWIGVPIARCADRAQRIAGGDLAVEPLIVVSKDEIGVLARAFDDMVGSLREIAGHSRTVTEHLNAAAAEILATTQQQASATKEQAAAVQQITSTVEEISQSSAQVSERARAVASAAQGISAAGAQGLEAVRHTSSAMELIREQAESVAENVVALSEKTQAIGEIIATVNDIAEQSNLVALNAAIEAADAREDGRRFAVVANEMKNLADQAKEATGQVRRILEQIQKGINTSVMLTEEAVKRVETGREKTQTAEQTIRRMAENIQENVSAFQQIVGATNQQQIGLEQVTQALHEIRQTSHQTAASTRQLEEAAGNVTGLGHQLRRVMEKYRL